MQSFHTGTAQSICAGGKLQTFEKPLIMGILNITPDSFYDGGQHNSLNQAFEKALTLIHEGVDIIDIGAYSTRPGAIAIDAKTETERALPIIEKLHREFPDVILSVDTFRADVAEACINSGAHIINDVSGGTLDPRMFDTVARLQVPYILMHMRGTPQTMQHFVDYQDIVTDIATDLGKKVAHLRQLGVRDIILDPGFGFAKTLEQNYELLYRIQELSYFHLPILGGISRKSMIYKKLDTSPREALNGTTALNTLLLERGVHILRVHDVKEAKELVHLFF